MGNKCRHQYGWGRYESKKHKETLQNPPDNIELSQNLPVAIIVKVYLGIRSVVRSPQISLISIQLSQIIT